MMKRTINGIAWKEVESVSQRTALGVLCFDQATDQPIRFGLSAWLTGDGSITPNVRARSTPSGTLIFHPIPGLAFWENESVPGKIPLRYVLAIRDTSEALTPINMRVQIPWEGDRLLLSSLNAGTAGAMLSPPAADAFFYLFSAPARTLGSGFAAIRGTCIDEIRNIPAGFAFVCITIAGRRFYGICDERGEFAVILPYPRMTVSISGSPPLSSAPISAQQWDMTVTIGYEPNALLWRGPDSLPDLSAIAGQRSALLRKNSITPVMPAFSVSLHYGSDCIVVTENHSILLIQES
jgi:hypothetical protein